MHALVSIHDVMPETLDRVRYIIKQLPAACRPFLTLLVVPGRDWQREDLVQLRQWQDQGCLLAGHGWQHQVREYKGLYHKLHAALVSRAAGEHLPLSQDEILELMMRCHAWFGSHGLDTPDYYVPPAWALGHIDRDKLTCLPWRYIETTSGIHDLDQGLSISLPLCGFEADTAFRAGFLKLWNRLQARMASPRRPLRLSLHPDDPALRVSGQMEALLDEVTVSRDYHSLFRG